MGDTLMMERRRYAAPPGGAAGRGGRLAMMALAATAAITALATAPAAATPRKAPYWASITAGQARMRTGPGRNFPASWLYQRAGLPVKVIEVYPNWRKVADPDGTQGWIQSNLLSDQRTALVRGDVAPMRAAPNGGARVLFRAAPGVIGRIARCKAGWCEFDVTGRVGYIEISRIWGLDPNETVD